MLEALEKLLALQEKDQRLRAFRIESDAIPVEKKTKERLIKEAADRLEASKARAKEIEVSKKNLEVEAASKRDQISRYKTQQMQTRKNEEFTALSHEISAAEAVIESIEDKELALMEEAETLKPAIAEAERIFREEKEKFELQLKALDAKATNLQERISELETARGSALEGLDEDLLERYQRLFKNKNGSAIVSLEQDICSGCHMKVTTQTVVEVKAGNSVISCPQCGRLLYFPA